MDTVHSVADWERVLRAFAEEIKDWPKESYQLGDTRAFEVRSRTGDLVTGRRLEAPFNPGSMWGWLDGAKIGESSDSWTLFAGRDFTGSAHCSGAGRGDWWTVELPASWPGDGRQKFNDRDSGDLLFGSNLPGGPGYWLVKARPSEAPNWPKLHKGVVGKKKAEGIRLLGVLREKEYSPLFMALGDRQGRLLGWKPALGMGEVRAAMAAKMLTYGSLEDWENIDWRVRNRSLGREI